MKTLIVLLVAILCISTAVAETDAFYENAILASNSASCGGWIPCHAYFYINSSDHANLANDIDVTLTLLDGTPSKAKVHLEFGHYEEYTEQVNTPVCDIVLENGTTTCESNTVEVKKQRLVFSDKPRLHPGVNVVHVYSYDKPADEISDWNMLFDVPVEKGQKRTFDTRVKGWAIWSTGEDSTNFVYHVPVTINSTVNTNLSDFPAYFVLNTSALIAAGKMKSDCSDLRPLLNSTHVASYEIESGTCDTTSTVVWVKIPTLTANTTEISVYYGYPSAVDRQNPSTVWSNNFVSVWHFSNNALDSRNLNNGTNNGGTAIEGKFGNAYNFTANSQYIDFGTADSIAVVPYTISYWAQRSTTANNVFSKAGLAAKFWYSYDYGNGSLLLSCFVSNGITGIGVTTGIAMASSGWSHVTSMYNSSVHSSFINGMPAGSASGTCVGITGSPTYAHRRLLADGTLGPFDEMRVASVARTHDWVKAEHSQTYAIGTEQSDSPAANESTARDAILSGILNSTIASNYTTFSDHLVYIRTQDDAQYQARFDFFVGSGNKRWVFNYDQTNASALPAFENISPIFHIWQGVGLEEAEISEQVAALINSTS